MSRHSAKIAHREADAPWFASASLIVVDTSKVAPLVLLGCRGGLQETLLLARGYEFLLLLGERFRHLTEEYLRGSFGWTRLPPPSLIKGLLRRAGALQAIEFLIGAIGGVLGAVTTKATREFFKHCGYSLPVHFL